MDPIKIFYLIFRPAPKQTTLFVQEFAVQPNDDMIHHNDLTTGTIPIHLSTSARCHAGVSSLKSDAVVAWLLVESNESRVRYFGRT